MICTLCSHLSLAPLSSLTCITGSRHSITQSVTLILVIVYVVCLWYSNMQPPMKHSIQMLCCVQSADIPPPACLSPCCRFFSQPTSLWWYLGVAAAWKNEMSQQNVSHGVGDIYIGILHSRQLCRGCLFTPFSQTTPQLQLWMQIYAAKLTFSAIFMTTDSAVEAYSTPQTS